MTVRSEGDGYGDIRNDAEFERFYAAEYGRCRGLLRRRALSRAALWHIHERRLNEVLDDVVVEAFAKLRNQYHRYDPTRASLSTFLNVIALRMLSKALLMASRDCNREYVELETVAESCGDDGRLHSVVLRADVATTLARMSPAQSRALVLHYEAGWPVRDVARMTGTTDIATQSLLQRGRASFSREWNLQGKAKP